jgi:hypothetical protein
VTAWPAWLAEADEHPHSPPDIPRWSENYVSYVYSPRSGVGVWFHLSHVIGSTDLADLWEQVLCIVLPDDEFVMSRHFGRGHTADGSLTIGGLDYACESPFSRWRTRYFGGARLIRGDEMRAGPLTDGPHEAVEFDITATMMSPPFDYGTGTLEQSWAKAH